MHKTSFDLPESLYRQVNLAAASMGLSAGEFIRKALKVTLAVAADDNPALAAMFLFEAQREA